ncbi:alpha/beta hydrolase family protein [Pseudoduganella sp. RAF19]|uniref:alpha/beta hydrolase family protein n=2 Tax=unclassified Pseudoduganella TaxID=2637179 RepID=UPI003F94C7AC
MIKKALAAALFTFAASVAAAPLPVKLFFENAQYSDARISPSGRYVAVKIGNDKLRDSLGVLDTSTMALIGTIRMSDQDIGSFRWLNDKQLLYTIADRTQTPGDMRYAPGLFLIDRDGGNGRILAARRWDTGAETGTMIKARFQPWNTYLMNQEGPQDSDILYVRRPVWHEEKNTYEIMRTDLVRIDAGTGMGEVISRPANPEGWLLDVKGVPRLMTSLSEGIETLHYLDPATSSWRVISSTKAYGPHAGFAPLGFMDEHHLLVQSYAGGDKLTLRQFDLVTGKMDKEPLMELADFDFSGTLVYINDKLAGIQYLADGYGSAWFDPGMKEVQKQVDALLPGLNNRITPPRHPQTPWVLVRSTSDRQPSLFQLYNTETHKLVVLGSRHPGIHAADMGQMDLVKFKARDGLAIPAWVTMPKGGGKKLPMVVIVHGGPYVRGTDWTWDEDSQFLASRGYAVIQPEFRGSTGYGFQLFSAGRKQWGLAMQDDIADAVKWAVAQGIADPKRVCILGGSYGGYATLMGLIKDPDLYRCGVAFAAVTDIPLMFDSGDMVLSDMGDDYKQYGAPHLIGDVNKDTEQFIATSPLKQAARIKRPLLLAHGTDDHRVPFTHYSKLRSALQANKADVEYIEYSGEGHGWLLPENRYDFWTRVEKFLDKNIGPGAKTE